MTVAATGPPRGSILIAEDDDDIRRLLDVMLTRAGFAVAAVADGVAVLAAAEAGRYDLYLLDVNMPGMTGLQACRELKARHDRPVVIMSAGTTRELMDEVRESGCDDYLEKPIPRDRLVRTLEAALA